MLTGIILLWFILTALSIAFVAVDIRTTPESPVLKWAFVLITAYTGPFGVFLYVLGCREPLPGLHARYVAVRWRQVLGSTMHCVAGDGIGILVGAVIGSVFHLTAPFHIALEYVLGFGFGWTIFQALFMREMAGGSFSRSLRMTLISEFLSMNALMAGMVPVMTLLMASIQRSESPCHADFWFAMSMALFAGGVVAYPMNWWLVVRHLKHGMMTVERPEVRHHRAAGHMTDDMPQMDHAVVTATHAEGPSQSAVLWMAALSIALFAVGVLVSFIFAPSH